jgi:hypothetical protein
MFFHIFTELCKHYQNLNLGHFYPVQKETLYPLSEALFHSFPMILANLTLMFLAYYSSSPV